MRFHRTIALFLGILCLGVGISVFFLSGNARAGDVPTDDPAIPAAMSSYSNASFTVRYNPANCQGAVTPWTAEGQAAMNHVVDILDSLLLNDGTIVIEVCLEPQGEDTLAAAGPNGSYESCETGNGALPVTNTAYPVALANALCDADLNGAEAEITASANADIDWDFCTTNCTWTDTQKYDFVSTMIHELLHGLGWVDNIVLQNGDAFFDGTPNVFSRLLVCNGATDGVCSDGQRLTDLPDGTTLAAAIQVGSGKLAFAGPNAQAAFAGEFANTAGIQGPFLFAPNPYQEGSSVSHWDDDHLANMGRMMNAATDAGPSSRIVDAITLMSLKDLGWSVLESQDLSDRALESYGVAGHINDSDVVGILHLGATFTTEAGPNRTASADSGDDGVSPSVWGDGLQGGEIQVTVANQQGCLSGWVDWNRDGNFSDPGEAVLTMRPITSGIATLRFDVPANTLGAANVTLAARFRLVPDWDGDATCDDQAAVQPAGTVFGGEVEDYTWTFDANGRPAQETTLLLYLPVITRD